MKVESGMAVGCILQTPRSTLSSMQKTDVAFETELPVSLCHSTFHCRPRPSASPGAEFHFPLLVVHRRAEVLHGLAQFGEVEGLCKHAIGPERLVGFPQFACEEGGQYHGLPAETRGAKFGQQFEAGEARHRVIGDQDMVMERFFLEAGERLVAVAHGIDGMAAVAQHKSHGDYGGFLIVHDEDIQVFGSGGVISKRDWRPR